jgi:choline-sulfatase
MCPNILLIQTDQMAASALGVYGNPVTRTPAIGRLAAEGALFESAYCNFPLCAPSRFSMMAGQLASRIGAWDNGAEFPAEIPTFAHYLQARGYRTCLSGKMHFVGPDQLHGFEERLTSDIYPADFAWAADWEGDLHRDTNGPMLVEKAGRCTASVQIDYDEQVAARACDWLAAQDGHRPFLLTVSFTHPHDPYVCPDPYWSDLEGAEIPMPHTPWAEDAYAQRLRHQYGMAESRFSDDQIRTARRAYYGSNAYVDAKIGAVMDALERAGLAETTVVILTSDHGDMLGEHGLWMKKHIYEDAIRIPLIVRAPGRVVPRRVQGLVSLADLLPTLIGFADGEGESGPPPAEDLSGIDLSACLRAGTDAPERDLMVEMTCEGTPAPIFILRRGPVKCVRSPGGPPMLFDLAADPDETENRAGSAAYRETEEALVADIERLWDAPALDAAIRRSQRRRRLIRQAHGESKIPPDWDYHESAEPDRRWMRSGTTYNTWAYGSIDGLTDAAE